MMRALKSEFLKLMTIRSTYILLFFTLALSFLISFYGNGMKLGTSELSNPNMLTMHMAMSASIIATLIAFLGILNVTHEYRYNTIMYSLTAAKSRSHLFWAKWMVITVVTTVLSVAFTFLTIPLVKWGISVSGHELVHQVIPVWDILWRVAFASWASAIIGLILGLLIRNQVGTFSAYFIIPTIEPLIGMILGDNRIYLPFTALSGVLATAVDGVSFGKAAVITLGYIVGGTAVAWYLFKRRDAN